MVAEVGLTDAVVAKRLGIEIESVKTYLSRVYHKWDVCGRAVAVAEYIRRSNRTDG